MGGIVENSLPQHCWKKLCWGLSTAQSNGLRRLRIPLK
jgi:hypothetical protein